MDTIAVLLSVIALVVAVHGRIVHERVTCEANVVAEYNSGYVNYRVRVCNTGFRPLSVTDVTCIAPGGEGGSTLQMETVHGRHGNHFLAPGEFVDFIFPSQREDAVYFGLHGTKFRVTYAHRHRRPDYLDVPHHSATISKFATRLAETLARRLEGEVTYEAGSSVIRVAGRVKDIILDVSLAILAPDQRIGSSTWNRVSRSPEYHRIIQDKEVADICSRLHAALPAVFTQGDPLEHQLGFEKGLVSVFWARSVVQQLKDGKVPRI